MTAEAIFAGRTAIVTGASGSIGGAIASALIDAGASVHAPGRREPLDSRAIWRPFDVADQDRLSEQADALAADLPEVDILVNAAGAYTAGSLLACDPEDVDQQWRVNVRTPWLLTRAFYPALARQQGWVVFLNSSVWDNARAGLGAYAMGKYALKALADAMRGEMNAEGVRVMSVYPGRTAGRIQEALFESEGRTYHPDALLQPEEVAGTILSAMALPTTAEVTDVYIRPGLKPPA